MSHWDETESEGIGETISSIPVVSAPKANGQHSTETGEGSGWTLLTNHSHVLVCLANDPSARVRDIAEWVGITERAIQRIIADLEEGGILSRHRDGRRNHYVVHGDMPLRHPLEAHCTVNDLLRLLRR